MGARRGAGAATKARGIPLDCAVTEEPLDKGLQAPGQTDTGKRGKQGGRGGGDVAVSEINRGP